MREELTKFRGQRRVFQGEFKRFGRKTHYHYGWVTTILLVDVIDVITKSLVTDHIWFTCGKRFDQLDLQEGDQVRFTARVTRYLKGYQGYRSDTDEEGYQEVDYRLSYPTKVEKVI